MQLSRREMTMLVAAVTLAALVPAIAFFFVPGYREMFSAFPGQWPRQTRLLFDWYRLSLAFPALVAGVWLLVPRTKRATFALLLSRLGGLALIVWIARTIAPTELVLESIRRCCSQ